MQEYGNNFDVVGQTIEVRSVGKVPLVVGRGVAAIVGQATRGPVGEVVLLSTPGDARALFHSGALLDGIEVMLAQGVDVVAAAGVKGVGYAKASRTLQDNVGTPNNVGEAEAVSPGNWGNAVRLIIEDGIFSGWETQVLNGDGTDGPFYLDNWDLEEDAGNYVKVDGLARTLVYTLGELATGGVYVDKTEGSWQFYEGEGPDSSHKMEISMKHKSRKITVTDNTRRETHHVSSYVKLQAAMLTSGLIRYTPAPGETHLPKNGTFVLIGGSDGAAVTLDDYETGLELMLNLPQGVIPTTIALTEYEVHEGTGDLIPELDALVTESANRFVPMIGFVAYRKNATMSELLALKSGYNNPFLCIGANYWDNSENEQNLAPARAGTEAAISLGDSAADDNNVIHGIDGLLWQFSPEEKVVLTKNGVDVLVKETGVKPHLGVTTNPDDNFLRTVDMRTVAWGMIACDQIFKKFYHKRRTRQTLVSMKASMETVLQEQVSLQVLDDYQIMIKANEYDRNKVDVDLWIQPVGHVERIHTVLSVGYWSSVGLEAVGSITATA